MACFIVPAAEAVITTGIMKILEHREAKNTSPEAIREAEVTKGAASVDGASIQTEAACATHLTLSHKLKWLNTMLWGGAGLLAFEHLWHGEIIAQFPFLTAAATAEGTAEMLSEMATSGTAMAVLVTLVWAGMVGVTHRIETRSAQEPAGEEAAAV